MTIFEILMAVIIKTDTDNSKCNKIDINFIHEMRMHDETSNWFDIGKTIVFLMIQRKKIEIQFFVKKKKNKKKV